MALAALSLAMAPLLVPLWASAQVQPTLVKKGARMQRLPSPQRVLPQADEAAIQERTREFREGLLREGHVPLDETAIPLRALIEEARAALERDSAAELAATATRIDEARTAIDRRAATMERHFDALERSLDRWPNSSLLRARLGVQREHLRQRRTEAVEALWTAHSGIEDRRSGFWGRVRDRVRRIFGRDPASRMEQFDLQMRRWNAANAPQVLGAIASNEGLSYIQWPSALAPLPSQVIVPAYVRGGEVHLEDLTKDSETEPNDNLASKAGQLRTAAAISSFVKNDMQIEWYRGCLKGAAETLREGGGNDADLAALTIALLRAQQIPARYVYGTIELPVGKLADLMRLLDAQALGAFYASPGTWAAPQSVREAVIRVLQAAGIPFEPVVTGGRVAAVRIAHVWVEAFVAYGDYRGTGRGAGPKAWVALEPSIPGGAKYEVRSGALDLAAGLGDGVEGLISEYLAAPTPASPLALLRERAMQLAETRGLSFDDLQRRVIARRESLPFLTGSLPYKVVKIHGEYAVLPDSMKHSARVRVEDDAGVTLDVTLPLHRLVGERSVLIYLPATDADAELIASSGGYWAAPASLVEVRAALRVRGAVVGQATRPAGLGAQQQWSLEISDPGGTVRKVANPIIAGNLVALGMGAPRNGYIEGDLYRLGDDDGPAPRFDYSQAVAYGNAWSDAEDELARLFNVVRIHPTANVTLYQSQLQVEEVLGVRQRVAWKGLAIDADLRPMTPVELSPGGARALFQLSGHQGSWQEQRTLTDGLGGVPAVSTVTLLQQAAAQGVPVVEITSSNSVSLLPTLKVDSAVRREIADHIARGRVVRVPTRSIPLEDWIGDGFIATDQRTGEAGYFLSGAIAGGMTVLSTLRYQSAAQVEVANHAYLPAGQSLDWATAFARDKISNLVAASAQVPSVLLDDLKPTRLRVCAVAQWSKLVAGELTTYAAYVKGAPVSFFPWDKARPAIGAQPALNALTTGSPQAVIAAIHAASVGEQNAFVTNTLEDGCAEAFFLPDPEIGAGATGVMVDQYGHALASLNGLNQVMAQVVGTRPHVVGTEDTGSTASYTLRLMWPLNVAIRPGEPHDVRPDWGTELGPAVAGIEFGTPLSVSVVDQFGNRLGGKELKWSDAGAGGRFVDLAEAKKAGVDLSLKGAQLLDYTAVFQKAPLPQTTHPFRSMVVTYIPPMSDGALDIAISAASGGFTCPWRVTGPPAPRYTLELNAYRTATWCGITNTYFTDPVIANLYRKDGAVWTPVTDKTPGIQSARVAAVTSTISGPYAAPETKGTGGAGLFFGTNGDVSIRPKFLAREGQQVTVVQAEVIDDKGKRVCCDDEWSVWASASPVRLEFERVDSGLRSIELPTNSPSPTVPASTTALARTTDLLLRVMITNPSSSPIYLKPTDEGSILRKLQDPLGYAALAPSLPGMITLMSGSSRIDMPLNRSGSGEPGSRYSLPNSGHVYFDVYASNVSPGHSPQSLDFDASTGSAVHFMPSAATPAKGPDIQFVGGWDCTYEIVSHTLHCSDPANREVWFSPEPMTTYSGTKGRYCQNQPCAQCYANKLGPVGGPIPRGTYHITQGMLDTARNYMGYRLEKVWSECEAVSGGGIHNAYMIHFGKTIDVEGTGTYSAGCIVVTDDAARDRLNELGGGTLSVYFSGEPTCDAPGYGSFIESATYCANGN